MPPIKVHDEEGNEYEIDLEDDDSDDEDEDQDNIYLTEKDLRWLKEKRKAESDSSNGTSQQKPQKRKSGIAVKKSPSQPQKGTDSQKKSRIRKLTI